MHWIKPNPAKTPVTNLFVLFDVYLVKNWILPSTAIGRIKTKPVIILIFSNRIEYIIEIMYPIIIPVHLAHTGN